MERERQIQQEEEIPQRKKKKRGRNCARCLLIAINVPFSVLGVTVLAMSTLMYTWQNELVIWAEMANDTFLVIGDEVTFGPVPANNISFRMHSENISTSTITTTTIKATTVNSSTAAEKMPIWQRAVILRPSTSAASWFNLENVVIACIAAGGSLALVSALGYWGSCCRAKCITIMHAVLLLPLTILDLASGISLIFVKEQFLTDMKELLLQKWDCMRCVKLINALDRVSRPVAGILIVVGTCQLLLLAIVSLYIGQLRKRKGHPKNSRNITFSNSGNYPRDEGVARGGSITTRRTRSKSSLHPDNIEDVDAYIRKHAKRSIPLNKLHKHSPRTQLSTIKSIGSDGSPRRPLPPIPDVHTPDDFARYRDSEIEIATTPCNRRRPTRIAVPTPSPPAQFVFRRKLAEIVRSSSNALRNISRASSANSVYMQQMPTPIPIIITRSTPPIGEQTSPPEEVENSPLLRLDSDYDFDETDDEERKSQMNFCQMKNGQQAEDAADEEDDERRPSPSPPPPPPPPTPVKINKNSLSRPTIPSFNIDQN